MRAEDGGIASQVVKVVHDDGHEEIEHDERTEKDERDEIEVGEIRAAVLVRVQEFSRRLVVLEGHFIARSSGLRV